MKESGNRNVPRRENRSGLLNGDFGTGAEEVIAGATILVGSSEFLIDDAIQMHLVDCEQCRHATEHMKPKAVGQKTGLCDVYLHLQILRAQYEGRTNNIVSHTEYGDEAPKGRGLE